MKNTIFEIELIIRNVTAIVHVHLLGHLDDLITNVTEITLFIFLILSLQLLLLKTYCTHQTTKGTLKQRSRIMCNILRGWLLPLAAWLPWTPADPEWQVSLNWTVWFVICSNLCEDKQHRSETIAHNVGRLSEHSRNTNFDVIILHSLDRFGSRMFWCAVLKKWKVSQMFCQLPCHCTTCPLTVVCNIFLHVIRRIQVGP